MGSCAHVRMTGTKVVRLSEVSGSVTPEVSTTGCQLSVRAEGQSKAQADDRSVPQIVGKCRAAVPFTCWNGRRDPGRIASSRLPTDASLQGFSNTTFPSRNTAIGVPCMRAVLRAAFAARRRARPTASTKESCPAFVRLLAIGSCDELRGTPCIVIHSPAIRKDFVRRSEVTPTPFEPSTHVRFRHVVPALLHTAYQRL